MTQINPLTQAIAQTFVAQKVVASNRDAERRTPVIERERTGLIDGPSDEYVESADAVEAVGQDQHHHDPREEPSQKRHSPADDDAVDSAENNNEDNGNEPNESGDANADDVDRHATAISKNASSSNPSDAAGPGNAARVMKPLIYTADATVVSPDPAIALASGRTNDSALPHLDVVG